MPMVKAAFRRHIILLMRKGAIQMTSKERHAFEKNCMDGFKDIAFPGMTVAKEKPPQDASSSRQPLTQMPSRWLPNTIRTSPSGELQFRNTSSGARRERPCKKLSIPSRSSC
jgi:hypothetical protein